MRQILSVSWAAPYLCAAMLFQHLIGASGSAQALGDEPATPTTVDQSFQFGETNITAINDLELFPDGRIAYGGVGRFETVGVASANGAVADSSAGWLLTNVMSLTVDLVDRVIYSGGAAAGEFTYGVQKSLDWDDINWGSLAKVRGRGNRILQLEDRSLLVAGRLQVTGDTNIYGLVKLDLAGNLYTGFFYDSTKDWEVTDAAIMADGSILAALQHTNDNQLSFSYYRLESNGVRQGIPFWVFDSRVSVMARMPGTDSILLAHEEVMEGEIETRFSWVSENGAAPGPADAWPKVKGKVHAIAFETVTSATANDGGYDRVIIAGEFSQVGTNDCNNLASLNKDGSVAWCFSTNAGPNGAIRDVEVQLDGKVLFAGTFTNVSGVEAKGMARVHGSSASGRSYLFWADSDYAVSESEGKAILTLKRGGILHEPLVVNLAANTDAFPTTINVPPQVSFGPGEAESQAELGIINNLQANGRRTLRITATTTNENLIINRRTTTLAVLDDETVGTLDPKFKPEIPQFRSVFAIQDDGKIIIGGIGTGLQRMNPDGSLDPTFVTNGVPNVSGGQVQQILPQPNGKIYIAGSFSTTNANYGINNLARLNSDGTLDRSFDPRLSRGSLPRPVKLHVLADSDLLIWLPSSVTQLGLGGPTGILRLNNAGFAVGSFQGVNTWSNEPIWEVGEFGEVFTFGAVVPRTIQKYSAAGASIIEFQVTGLTGRLFDMEATSDGLIIGGNFTLAAGTSNLAKVDFTTGAVHTNFSPVVNGTVYTAKVHGQKVYITGDFTEVNGQPRYRIARLNLNGSLDETFNAGFGPNRPPGILDVQIDGSVIIGSSFDRVDGVAITPFARLEGDASPGEIRLVSTRIEAGATNEFVTVEMARVGGSRGQLSSTLFTVEGSALAGQQFAETNLTVTFLDGEFGTKTFRISLYPDSSAKELRTFTIVAGAFPDYAEATILIRPSLLMGSASSSGGMNLFHDIAVETNGWIYAVGIFNNVNGVAATNIVRLTADLAVDESFRPAELPALVSDGTTNYFALLKTVATTETGVVVGGQFNAVGTNDWASVVQIRADGSYDEAFNAAARIAISTETNETRHVLRQPDGKLVLSIPGINAKRLAANGTLDATFSGRFTHGGEVWLDSVGRLYTLSSSTVGRYLQNGFNDTGSISVGYLGSPNPTPLLNTLAIQSDGKLLLGGAFSRIVSTPQQPITPRLVRVLTSLVADTNFVAQVEEPIGSTRRNRVTAIQLLENGNILIGGIFDVVNGERRTMLALLNSNGEVRNDFKVDVVGEQIDQFALLPDGDVVVRGRVTSVDGVEVGNLFKLSIPKMKPPVAKFLWPTNGSEVRVYDTPNVIQVQAFDPDGFVEKVVLELDGQTIATNPSGNLPFQIFLSGSVEHELRISVTDDTGLSTSETVTFRTVQIGDAQNLTITSDGSEVVITYQHGLLLESTDLRTWTEVHRGGGQYRTSPSGTHRFYGAAGL